MGVAETPRPEDPLLPGLKWSLLAHLLFFLLVLFKSLMFPSTIVPLIPTLKVDLVALPDLLKKDLMQPHHSQFNQDISQLLKRVEKEAKKPLPHEPTDTPRKNSPGSSTEKQKHITNKNLLALRRIKALAKIEGSSEEAPSETEHLQHLIKGNKISHGTSLSGEARESLQTSYYDSVRDQLKDNWTLPPWIARQDFAAQVRIFIDSRGQLREFKFEKVSGNSQFDHAVKRTLELSHLFPIPPKELASTLLADGILIGFPL